ncbi:hypothetical protein, partial [Acinetobacter pittii]|uniref:hypothetical protein n=1 Tax=Acinetobacter pittii TaxID=48296 RepID=UPI002812AB6B
SLRHWNPFCPNGRVEYAAEQPKETPFTTCEPFHIRFSDIISRTGRSYKKGKRFLELYPNCEFSRERLAPGSPGAY